MAIDLSKLSPKELQELISAAAKQSEVAAKERIVTVRTKIETILKNEGLSLDEVFSRRGGKTKSVKHPVAPKYRDPTDPSLTWSGRGKRPLWFNNALKSGATPESLLIDGKKSATPAVKKAVAKKSAAKKAAKKQSTEHVGQVPAFHISPRV